MKKISFLHVTTNQLAQLSAKTEPVALLILNLLLVFVPQTITAQHYLIPTRFNQSPTPPHPDYSKHENWSALPTKNDPADLTPRVY
ncbi:MAG: hypothetical protein ACK5BM_00045 [Bacteroidota bacterium]